VLCTIIYAVLFLGAVYLLYTRIVGQLKEVEDYIYLLLSLLAVVITGFVGLIIYRQNVKKDWSE
jgi:branched-subunit amino acid ABC-type transport system permease component